MWYRIKLMSNKQVMAGAFLLSLLFYFIALIIELNFIFTDSYYFDNYSIRTAEEIFQLMNVDRKGNWINFIYLPFHILIPALAFSLFLYITFYLLKPAQDIFVCFKIALISQIVYALNYFATVLIKISNILPVNYTNVNDLYEYQSIVTFFTKMNLPDWAIYPLSKLNIAELVYFVFLIILIIVCTKCRISKAVIIATVSFLFFMITIITIVLYLQILYR